MSPSQQPTVLFSIYQNNSWTIRRLVNETINPATQRIILKIVEFQNKQQVLRANCPKTYTVPFDHKRLTSLLASFKSEPTWIMAAKR